MKQIILAFVIMACFVSHINAQVHFGLKGGVNFVDFRIHDAKTNLTVDNSTGWQAGALLQLKIPGMGVAFQPELLYTVSKANVGQASNDIHYFDVPLNLQFGLDLVLLRPYLLAGPYFGYALKTDGDNFKDNINKFDWGIGLGGGLEIWKLQLDARYSWGLQNMSMKEFEMKHNRFTLSLAILF